jgi:CRP/FNR family transcriptional regulator
MGAMSERLARKEHMHLVLARDGAARRLAGFLVDLCERRDSAGLDGDHITLPMSRGEIASYLALAVETVSRILTRMQRAGTIQVNRSNLVVLDRAALCEEAGVSPEEIPNEQAVSHH